MKKFIEQHPLAFVLIIAALVRAIAVIFSKGFIYSDDHFDTITICYYWLQHGIWGADGHLQWGRQHVDIVRFPLYTLANYFIMVIYKSLGITALDKMMYGIRAIHAAISLLPVWAVFGIIKIGTKNVKWALWGGLAVALHCALPFLGVRNLIELVGGSFWVVSLYFIYRYWRDRRGMDLIYSGLIAGLAWMIRFQLAFAIIPIPFLIWYEYKSLRPAVYYSLAVGLMLLFSGLVDWYLMGYFAASTINNLTINTVHLEMYKVIPLLYPVEILAFFIPPFSIVAIWFAFRKSLWKEHKIIVVSSLFFIIVHMLHPNQQERFMLPIIFALFPILVFGLWYRFRDKGYIVKNRAVFNWLLGISLALNFILLPLFTTAYGHEGMIEPLIKIERMHPRPIVKFMQVGIKRWIPDEYAGFVPLQHHYVRTWDDWNLAQKPGEKELDFNYFVVYPFGENTLKMYFDSIQARYGKIDFDYYQEPSLYDRLLHTLNPRHNCSFEAYIYHLAEPGN